ncbi:DUF2339 domain-containing protein [Thiomicrorhabdus xiamenensis]|uniref:DUF2339 domain-containing protein n=1 Tax=Thiomicrorhabdus xiamenensis TaxID=2739063 RepID=A0A7D4T9S5_9GAMM|nr:DUF2339 domain-containing protein [Thiomicrorhabdus xiamenensis]QKI88786.1 DUF2339 domain-containing protein [Thiomicrorhabdus xiamenensis]
MAELILFLTLIVFGLYSEEFFATLLAGIVIWILLQKNNQLQNQLNKLLAEFETFKQSTNRPEPSAKKHSPPQESGETLASTQSPHSATIPSNETPQGARQTSPVPKAKWKSVSPWNKDSKDDQTDNAKPLIASVQQYLRSGSLPPWLNWFIESNVTTKIGLFVLFFGLGFLLKYAADQGLLPIELRLLAIAILGLILLLIGLKLFTKQKQQNFALLLQGGGIGILYLTTYFAFKFYDVIPVSAGFFILLLVMASSIYLAVKQDAQPLAFMGALGGFLAPILASTGQGSHIILFSYYIVLNLSIFAIAWFKAWRRLNLLGFVMTFWIAIFWGWFRYTPENYLSVQLFLIAFFLLYTAIAVLFAFKQPPNLKGMVDGTIVFGTPIISFVIQTDLMRPFEDGLATSSLILGLFYLALGFGLMKKAGSDLKLLYQAFSALGVIFLTITVPLFFDDHVVSAIWSIEACGIIWLALRQRQSLGLYFGILLQLLASQFFYIAQFALISSAETAIFNAFYLGGLLVGVANLLSAFMLYKSRSLQSMEIRAASILLLIIGTLWWFSIHWLEIERFASFDWQTFGILTHLLITSLLITAIEVRFNWQDLRYYRPLWLVFLLLYALYLFDHNSHPFAHHAWIVWLFNGAAFYAILKWLENHSPESILFGKQLHALSLYLFIGILALEGQHYATHHYLDWVAASLLLFMLPVILGQSLINQRRFWPFNAHAELYLNTLALPLLLIIFVWLISFNLASAGEALGTFYLPLLNTLDLLALTGFSVLYQWLKSDTQNARSIIDRGAWYLFGIALFAFANAVILRLLYHWYDIYYSLHIWLNSSTTQTTLAIFWSLLGVAIMKWAQKSAKRTLWLAGSALLALVVIKLFIFDLSNSGTIARIISFIGVGGILITVGYFFPIPPQSKPPIKNPAEESPNKP